MKVLLLDPQSDFDPQLLIRDRLPRERDTDWRRLLPAHEQALVQDLELDALFQAMANGDDFLYEVTRKALLAGFQNSADTILHRQGALRDCLENPTEVRSLYALTVDAIETSRRHAWGLSTHYPGSMLYTALDLLESLSGMLRQLRDRTASLAPKFDSKAFTDLFRMLADELNEEYLGTIDAYLRDLKFQKGVLLSAKLGEWNEATDYILRLAHGKDPNWFQRLLGKKIPGFTYDLDPRDEAGAQILGDIRQRAISRVALALAQSADHVLNFFKKLRTELAFYVASLNLYAQLTAREEPICFPKLAPVGSRVQVLQGLFDVSLSLHMPSRVVGNSATLTGSNLVVITGANQGGKSSFLRSIGIAQVMMQAGMFVGAESYEGELARALFTHYKREEDRTMTSGKFDEELARMSAIADHVRPGAMILFNESFAATNEREGSEIARQVVGALLEKHIKIFFVTHLYDFAHAFVEKKDALFLRPERLEDGTRTFRLIVAEPLETSYGEDLYRQIFETSDRVPATLL
jgi:MutS domain V